MSEPRQSGINRAFSWLKRTLQITEKTVAPDFLFSGAQPVLDLFGWERLAPAIVGPGGPESLSANGADNADTAQFGVVPEGVMRLILRASMSTNDLLTGMTLSMQVTSGGIAVAIAAARIEPAVVPGSEPARYPLDRWILMGPGDQLGVRSSTAPAVGSRLNIRMQFVDLDVGEYVAPL